MTRVTHNNLIDWDKFGKDIRTKMATLSMPYRMKVDYIQYPVQSMLQRIQYGMSCGTGTFVHLCFKLGLNPMDYYLQPSEETES